MDNTTIWGQNHSAETIPLGDDDHQDVPISLVIIYIIIGTVCF